MTKDNQGALSLGERKLVAEALAMLPVGPWAVASSNSFRRINGPDGKDGGVLHAYAQRGDGHPDLSMSEAHLWALCRVVNAMPRLLVALEEAEGREHRVCAGCGTRWGRAALDVAGAISCCPERKMLSAKEWAARAEKAEQRAKDLEETLSLSPSKSEADKHG